MLGMSIHHTCGAYSHMSCSEPRPRALVLLPTQMLYTAAHQMAATAIINPDALASTCVQCRLFAKASHRSVPHKCG